MAAHVWGLNSTPYLHSSHQSLLCTFTLSFQNPLNGHSVCGLYWKLTPLSFTGTPESTISASPSMCSARWTTGPARSATSIQCTEPYHLGRELYLKIWRRILRRSESRSYEPMIWKDRCGLLHSYLLGSPNIR